MSVTKPMKNGNDNNNNTITSKNNSRSELSSHLSGAKSDRNLATWTAFSAGISSTATQVLVPALESTVDAIKFHVEELHKLEAALLEAVRNGINLEAISKAIYDICHNLPHVIKKELEKHLHGEHIAAHYQKLVNDLITKQIESIEAVIKHIFSELGAYGDTVIHTANGVITTVKDMFSFFSIGTLLFFTRFVWRLSKGFISDAPWDKFLKSLIVETAVDASGVAGGMAAAKVSGLGGAVFAKCFIAAKYAFLIKTLPVACAVGGGMIGAYYCAQGARYAINCMWEDDSSKKNY